MNSRRLISAPNAGDSIALAQAWPEVPIIMITAYGDVETKRQALEKGAEALLTKPIDFGMLRSGSIRALNAPHNRSRAVS